MTHSISATRSSLSRLPSFLRGVRPGAIATLLFSVVALILFGVASAQTLNAADLVDAVTTATTDSVQAGQDITCAGFNAFFASTLTQIIMGIIIIITFVSAVVAYVMANNRGTSPSRVLMVILVLIFAATFIGLITSSLIPC